MNVIELTSRIEALRSKQKRVGPFRAAGIQLSIDSFKARLSALAAAARQGGDVKQAPAESPQSGGETATPTPSCNTYPGPGEEL